MGMPFIDYKSQLCNMAVFKVHGTFGFLKAALMETPAELAKKQNNTMRYFDEITSLKYLPADKTLYPGFCNL